MAISLLMPDGLALTAQQERQAKAPQHGGGSGRPLGGRSGFRVGTSSTVLSATSTTWTLGPCAIEIDPGAAVDQGMYGWANSANTTGAMTAADATYARKDIVYIQINDPTSGDGTASLSYAPQYLTGPMDGTNAPPALPVRSFLVGTISVPQAGGGSPTVVRNPAVYVAAGAPLPVSSQAERDALTPYDGLTVRRLDIAGRPTETYNGSTWPASDTTWTDVPLAGAFTYWTTNGWSGMKYAVKDGWVILNGAVTRGTSWAADATCGVMPAALKPAVRIQGSGVQVEPTAGNISLLAGGPGPVSFSATWPLF